MSIHPRKMQRSDSLSRPASPKGSELIKQFEEVDRIQDEMFFDINDGVFFTPYYGEPIYRNPYVDIEPICDVDEACKKKCLNLCSTLFLSSYSRMANEEDDKKTAQALRDCEAIWIYPVC